MNYQSNSQRTHDSFYKDIDPHLPPKDSFIKVGNLISGWLDDFSGIASIIDIGCATGAFLNYLSDRFPGHSISGYEHLEELIKAGQKNYPGIQITQASILDSKKIAPTSADVITVQGVISIFDDIAPIVKNLALWIKPGGKILIHGMFNPFNVDVFVKYRRSEEYGTDRVEAGWNVISQKTITDLFIKSGARQVRFHEFQISTDLEKNSQDPLRSWTEKLADGTRQIVNATCLKQPQFILDCDF
jgi:SAM-dependent methyltransferase